MSERDVTHSDLVEIAKRNGDFRKNYGVLVGAILYLRSINAARPRLFWWQNAEAMVSLLLTIMSIRRANLGLVSSFRLCQCLLDFSAALGALVDEVDLRHAPMGLDVSYVHRKS